MKILTYDSVKGRMVVAGELEGAIFTKKVKADHYIRILNAYGIQEVVIQQLKEKGCSSIVLKLPSMRLMSSLSDWLAPNIKILDYGHGKQRFLPVRMMTAI